MINTKELVYTIESIPGVSIHIPNHGIISIGNGSGYNPRVQTKGISSAAKIESDFGQEGVELNFYDGRRLIVTEVDFIFSVVQSGFFKVGDQLEAFAVSELRELLNSFRRQIESPNLDAVMGAFYQAYYILESASFMGFSIDRLISQLYADAKDLYFFELDQFPFFNNFSLGNKGLKLQRLKVEDCPNIGDFIRFWRKLYAYGKEEKYNLIHKELLSEKDIITLYEWKNGMDNLSGKKTKKLGRKNHL
jgi:hypothetical protein